MKYQVLARKYRPKSFATMMGQEHVLKALTNALETERLHHAYLFTGTRGVGKTTVARVLAKALNCEQGISASPCGTCNTCLEIDQGNFIDLIEVDAASKTKVEDTRELLDNVQYAPTHGRFKIYLIDEVHMLSGHSFNALLKTLEEPPEHVKFLLATTDPQKLPVTILSRCLQFNLKSLTIEQIEQQLSQILNTENISFATEILKPLAIAADGSMRDALSLLDQAIAYCDGKPNLADIETMLGCVQKDRIFDLLKALSEQDGAKLIDQSRLLFEQGLDANTLLAELITALQRIALSQLVPGAIDESLGDKQQVEAIAQHILPEDVQLYYQIALNGRKDLPFSPQPRGGFEMILLRMLSFRPDLAPDTLKKTPLSNQTVTQKKIKNQQHSSQTSSQTADNSRAEKKQHAEYQEKTSNKQQVIDNKAILATEQKKDNTAMEAELLPPEYDLPPLDSYNENYTTDVAFSGAVHDDMVQDKFIPEPVIHDPKMCEPVTDEPMLQKNPEVNQKNTPTLAPVVPLFENKDKPKLTLESEPGQEKKIESESNKDLKQTTEQNNIADKENSLIELADYWHQQIRESALTGLEQQLAKHCALINRSKKQDILKFDLILEPIHKHLLTDKTQQRLLEGLQSLLNTTIKLNFKYIQPKIKDNTTLDTPRRRELYEEKVKQEQAVKSIMTDKKLQILVNTFAATIHKESIKAL